MRPILIISDNNERIKELKNIYKSMGAKYINIVSNLEEAGKLLKSSNDSYIGHFTNDVKTNKINSFLENHKNIGIINEENKKHPSCIDYDGKDLENRINKIEEIISLKERPESKNNYKNNLLFRPLEGQEELEKYFKIRYEINKKINYLQDKSKQKIELDEYDKNSIALGGFVDGDLGIIVRIITDQINEEQYNETRKIIQDKNLIKKYESEINEPFPMIRDTKGKINHLINEHGPSNIVEYSRIMTTDKRFRGLHLSTSMIDYIFTYSQNLNKEIGLAICWKGHTNHNIEKNNFSGMVKNIGNFKPPSIEQESNIIYKELTTHKRRFNHEYII
ncbi:MAG: hypothetical protein ACQEP1_04090 [Nanobdellota archaeon]